MVTCRSDILLLMFVRALTSPFFTTVTNCGEDARPSASASLASCQRLTRLQRQLRQSFLFKDRTPLLLSESERSQRWACQELPSKRTDKFAQAQKQIHMSDLQIFGTAPISAEAMSLIGSTASTVQKKFKLQRITCDPTC